MTSASWMGSPTVCCRVTPRGLRLVQHGTVLSEVLRHPGPTHSVVDVIAAVICTLAPEGPVLVLGFAGGGLLAPLRAMHVWNPVDGVDTERAGFQVFEECCADWCGVVRFHHADALEHLQQPDAPRVGMVVEDLSVEEGQDVVKPRVVWEGLAGWTRNRLAEDGVALFNLLKPKDRTWRESTAAVRSGFDHAVEVLFDEFENRLVLASARPLDARVVSRGARAALRAIDSRQADRVAVRRLAATRPAKPEALIASGAAPR